MRFLLRPTWTVEKYLPDGTSHELTTFGGNMLMYSGSSAMWELLLGRTFTPFDTDNAFLGVGNGTGASAPSMTNLDGPIIVLKGMEAGFPAHLPGNVAGASSIRFRSLFPEGNAEFNWTEVALFNGAVAGRIFNRRVRDLGTKPPGVTWALGVSFTIQPENGST